TRAAMMFELSPEETAANAVASRIPAFSRTTRSKPAPVTVRPAKPPGSRSNDSGSRSIATTSNPAVSSSIASAAPTRPHPMITTLMAVPLLTAHTVRAHPVTLLTLAGAVREGAGVLRCVGVQDLQGVRRGEASPRGTPVPERHARGHPPAQADRAAGVRVRRTVLRRVRPAGDLPRA